MTSAIVFNGVPGPDRCENQRRLPGYHQCPGRGNYRRLACFTERFDDLQFIFTGNGVAKDENVESALLTLSKIFHSIGTGQAALVPDDSEVPRTASMSASGPSTPYRKVSAS